MAMRRYADRAMASPRTAAAPAGRTLVYRGRQKSELVQGIMFERGVPRAVSAVVAARIMAAKPNDFKEG